VQHGRQSGRTSRRSLCRCRRLVTTFEWGDAYSMVMFGGCPQMADVHDRMPVLLTPDEWDLWTQGRPEEAMALAQTV
jgi:putative SOS response-associated peptidase YedK